MIRSLALTGIAVSGLLLAASKTAGPVNDDEPKEKVRVTKTEHMDVPPNGVVRFRKSEGELTVEGWDGTDVEITTTKSTKEKYNSEGREQATRDLARVSVTAERKGDELAFVTLYPRHHVLVRPFAGTGDIDVDCVVKVPRNVRLEIDHMGGTVNIDDVRGDIHVTDRQGQIFLHLPQDGAYAIDAKTNLGAVQSDFAGHQQRRRVIEREFLHETPSKSQKLYLRIGFGDVTILKINEPETPGPVKK